MIGFVVAPGRRAPEPARTDSGIADACGALARSSTTAARQKKSGARAPLGI